MKDFSPLKLQSGISLCNLIIPWVNSSSNKDSVVLSGVKSFSFLFLFFFPLRRILFWAFLTRLPLRPLSLSNAHCNASMSSLNIINMIVASLLFLYFGYCNGIIVYTSKCLVNCNAYFIFYFFDCFIFYQV